MSAPGRDVCASSSAHERREPETPPSFDAVFRDHYGFVWRSLARLGVSDAALDDALQDVFVVVHRRLPSFVSRAAIRTWLFEIVRRVAWRHREAQKRGRRSSVAIHDLESPERSVEGRAEDRDALRLLNAWLGELDDDKRCAFILSELEQLRGPEIAKVLGVNLNTVYARIRAAREHMQSRARRLAIIDEAGRLRAVHRSEHPSAKQRSRTMAIVAAKTGTSAMGFAGTSTAAVGLKAALGVTLVVAVAGAVALRVDRSPESATEDAAGGSALPAASPSDTRPAVVAPAPSTAAMRAPTPVESAAPVEASAAATPPNRPRSDGAPVPTPRRRAVPSVPEPAPIVEPAVNALARDVALLSSAQRALRRGAIAAALRDVDQLLSGSPKSAVASEALAVRVEALCRSGRRQQAELQARSFAKRFPGSPLVDIANPCKS